MVSGETVSIVPLSSVKICKNLQLISIPLGYTRLFSLACYGKSSFSYFRSLELQGEILPVVFELYI